MKRLSLRVYPDRSLREKAVRVRKFDAELEETAKEMASIVRAARGVGLAATQVGLGMRLVVVTLDDRHVFMANPEIVWSSGRRVREEEGCLSLPGLSVRVARRERVKIKAQDVKGNFFTKDFASLAARIIQHEIDHLDGKLLIDYLNPIKRMIALNMLKKQKRM